MENKNWAFEENKWKGGSYKFEANVGLDFNPYMEITGPFFQYTSSNLQVSFEYLCVFELPFKK